MGERRKPHSGSLTQNETASMMTNRPFETLALPSSQPQMIIQTTGASDVLFQTGPAIPSARPPSEVPPQLSKQILSLAPEGDRSSHQQCDSDRRSASTINSDSRRQHGFAEKVPYAQGDFDIPYLPSTSNEDVCIPQKYRLNRSSNFWNSHTTENYDEPSLSAILEQERNAWQADIASDIVNDSESHANGSADVNPLQTGRHDPLHLPPTRKSCFQEGSMNEASRGIASTWYMAHSSHGQDCGPNPEVSDFSDIEEISRACVGSRASMCSSIDINEFKPLPATPSTFKSTIKRIGKRVTNAKSAASVDVPRALPKPPVTQKQGIRKSLSTWKLFSNPPSESEDDSKLLKKVDSLDVSTIRASRNVKTVRSCNNSTPIHQAVLDERKRKAATAYEEQFGTSKKRRRHSITDGDCEKHIQQESVLNNFTTVRRRDSIGTLGNDVSRSTSSMSCNMIHENTDQSTLSDSDDVSSPGVSRLKFTFSRRSKSQDPQGSRSDRLKKQSRSDLEKENHRLRGLLRMRNAEVLVQTGTSHNIGNLNTPADSRSAPTVAVAKPYAPVARMRPNTGLFENVPAAQNTRIGGDTGALELPTTPATLSKPQPFYLEADIPPVPPLPADLRQHKALSVSSGNIPRPADSATMKRREPSSQKIGASNLPRPLSMVLESLENEGEEGQENMEKNTCVKGLNSITERAAADETRATQHESKTTKQWTWPEDVF